MRTLNTILLPVLLDSRLLSLVVALALVAATLILGGDIAEAKRAISRYQQTL
jgi:hypothetical protein